MDEGGFKGKGNLQPLTAASNEELLKHFNYSHPNKNISLHYQLSFPSPSNMGHLNKNCNCLENKWRAGEKAKWDEQAEES